MVVLDRTVEVSFGELNGMHARDGGRFMAIGEKISMPSIAIPVELVIGMTKAMCLGLKNEFRGSKDADLKKKIDLLCEAAFQIE